MNKLRKFLVIGVMVLTVFATMGMYAPVNASASAGDLIKMDGLSSVYYLGSDGKRYVFPNEATYMSWYSDFSGVVTITASELQSYPLGGNVTMRPGTKLVKITTDPSVYAVEPNGVLRKIQSEAQAAALYGSNWNKRVVDVADSFFTNYTIGSALANGSTPAGSLVKNANNASIYYYDGTNYRSIANESAFNANRFLFGNVLTISNTITAGGTAIANAEFVNVAQNGVTTGPIVTGSGLMVSLNSATPAAASVPQNGARIPMAKVNLTAASDGAVTVNSITVKRTGLSTYNNVDKVWAEQNGVIVASKKSMNSNDESILTFSPALTVNAGQTIALDLIVSLKLDGNVAAGNIALSIASASAVSATAASVTGSFPINGNLMSATNYSVANVTISDGSAAGQAVKVGDEKAEIGKFQLAVNKDVTITSVMLKNNGAEDLSKATMNLYIEQAGNKVSTSYTVNDRFVTFYFANGVEILRDDSSKIFYLKGDIIAKENTSTSSLKFVLNKSTDLVVNEKATGFGANVIVSGGGSADSFAISEYEITSGAVSVSKKSTSPSNTTIIKGSDHVMLLANVRADEAVNVDGIKLTYGSGNGTATSTDDFENVRVYVNNILLDSFDPIATTSATETIDSSFTLNKGDNEVKIMAKAKSTATDGTIKFTLTGSAMFVNMNAEYVLSGNTIATPSGLATGAVFSVGGASLTTVKNDGYGLDKVIVAGSNDVSLGKFTVKAINDQVKITSISFGANVGSTTKTLDTSINDMKLFIDGTQIGNSVDFGSNGSNFSSLNLTIAKDSTKSIELKGSFDSAAAANSYFKTVMTINSQDSRGTSITENNVATTTQFKVSESGSLQVELGGNTPAAGMLASKSAEQEVAQFKFTAISDDASLTEINIINTPIASTSATVSSSSNGVVDADARIAAIKLYDGATLIDSFVPVSGEGKFTITNDKIKVLANTSKTLSIKVVLNDIVNDADATDKDIHLAITTLKFKSSNGAENIQGAAVLANNFRVRKTVPTVTLSALPATLLTAGNMVVSKFNVAADSNGDVTLRKVVLTYATSSGVVIGDIVGNAVKVNGVSKTSTSTVNVASSTITVEFATNEVISAGTSKTFEVLVNVSATGSNSQSLTTKISEDTSYTGTGTFEWSDGAHITTETWSNGYRVSGLSTDTQVLSKN